MYQWRLSKRYGVFRLTTSQQQTWNYRGNFTEGLASGSGELNFQAPLLLEPFRHYQGAFHQGRAQGEGIFTANQLVRLKSWRYFK